MLSDFLLLLKQEFGTLWSTYGTLATHGIHLPNLQEKALLIRLRISRNPVPSFMYKEEEEATTMAAAQVTSMDAAMAAATVHT